MLHKHKKKLLAAMKERTKPIQLKHFCKPVRSSSAKGDDHLCWSFILWDWVGSEVADEANMSLKNSGTLAAERLIFYLCQPVGSA